MNVVNPITCALFSAVLLLAAIGLMISHIHTWRRFQREGLDAEALEYRRRQYRRRMQTSAMLGGLAVALFVGPLLTQWLRSLEFALAFWGMVLLALLWVVLLAAVDVWATKRYFGRLRQNCMLEQMKLEAELRRIQAIRGNGKATRIRDGSIDGAEKNREE